MQRHLLAPFTLVLSAASLLAQDMRELRQYADADSVSLEQRPGGWNHTTFRITIRRDGVIRVTPDSMARSRFSVVAVHPEVFSELTGDLITVPISLIPAVIRRDSVYGRFCGTDQVTLILTVYHPQFTKRVEDYQGCQLAPASLRDLEKRILQIAGARPPNEEL